jgi:hypothetical protein
MTGPVARNSVVALLGTPDHYEGSLNDPVEREEFGVHYNEKWTYQHLVNDPSGASQRAIYWHRYDFIATMVRSDDSSEWRADTSLIEAGKDAANRLSKITDRHQAYSNSGRYRQVSTVRDARDLGGYVQEAGTWVVIGEEE